MNEPKNDFLAGYEAGYQAGIAKALALLKQKLAESQESEEDEQ